MKNLIFSLSVLLTSVLSLNAVADHTPLPVPKVIRVTSSIPRGPLWEKLSDKERNLGFHLFEAARAGRTVLFVQNHRHGLVIKGLLEEAFDAKNIDDTKMALGQTGFDELIKYGAKFMDLASPYETSNRKYLLNEVKPAQLEALFDYYSPNTPAETRSEVIRLLTDSSYEVLQMPESETGEGLEVTGGNFYAKGITAAEINKAIAEKKIVGCLNCRVARDSKGELINEVYTVKTPGPVGQALALTVQHLKNALPFASTAEQKLQFEHLITFFEKGDVEDFRQANIAWVKDRSNSTVDFMMGFVEVYQDFRGQMGSWESYIQVVDRETTKKSIRLAQNAQYFEDQMPYGKYKKKFPSDYSPPALMVYYFQEISSMRSAGYNLPNFDDIRRDVGAKNIIRLSLHGEDSDEETKKRRREVMQEFLPASTLDRTLANEELAWETLVLLHEIIGHGSGTYDEKKYGEKEDPISALGTLGSALEEQRADLTALVFGGDLKLVEVGQVKTPEQARLVRDVMYDAYLADFLRHVAKERTLTESHQRGNWLLVNLLIESGAVEWVAKDEKSAPTPENSVLKVKSYEQYHQVCVDLLAELQRIKAVRDEAALKKLFTEKAPIDAIKLPWAKAIIQRGEVIGINNGAVDQPWILTKELKFKTLCEKLLLEEAATSWKQL